MCLDLIAGFVQKKSLKIHKLFTNLCNMGQKSNTKVCNSAAHLVKGRNPYCSQRLLHFIRQNWLEVHSLWFCTAIFLDFFFLTTVWSWEVQFLTDKLIFFSLALWRPQNSQTFTDPHSVFTDFQGLEKLIPFFLNFQRPSKTVRTLYKH